MKRLVLMVIAIIAPLAVVAVLSGRDVPLLPPLRADLGAGPVANSHYVKTSTGFGEQGNVCAGVPVPQRVVKFDVAPNIVSLTVCDDFAQSTKVIDRNQFTQELFAEFARVLAVPDAPRQLNIACTEEWRIVSSFVIQLESGELVRPTPPVDVCSKPQAEFDQAFAQLIAWRYPED
jgi:hypothetical protein